MTTDVFNKLSQIIATHEAEGNDGDKINKILSRFDFDGEAKKKTEIDHAVRLPDRPTPYEVWKNKQTQAEKYVPQRKKVDKLTTTQVEKMISKMHANNRTKHEEAIRIQNEGLKSELEGYEFKPRINQTSLDLAATMKPIAERMPEMVAEKQRILARKREDRDKEEAATASFKPARQGAKTSDKYLKKMGRSAMARPEDFFLYHQEKIRRNEQRKNIIENIEAREMIFTPQLPETSRRIHEKMLTGPTQKISYDPVTRTTKVIKNPSKKALVGGSKSANYPFEEDSDAGLSQDDDLVEGPALVLESEHPYSHNRNEYTTVGVPGAVSYEITFSEETSTEPVHDFVRFLKYDDQTVVIGAGKYSGGIMDNKLPVKKLLANSKSQRYNVTRSKEASRTPCNWPGVGGREPLIIHASKFVVHFKTNGQLNDWGFRMNIVPTIHAPSAEMLSSGRLDFKPNISSKGSSYSNSLNTATGKVTSNIFERLYADAVTSGQKKHNQNVQNIQSKTKVTLKPWEQARETSPGEIHAWTANKTHTGKSLLGPALNELLIFDDEAKYASVSLVEHSHTSADLWNSLQNATIDENLALQLDDEEIDAAPKGRSYRTQVTSEHGRRSFGAAVTANEDYSDFSKMKMSDF